MSEGMMGGYNLAHEPITFMDAAFLLGQPECAIAADTLNGHTVSTVFLVHAHGDRNGLPVLYETMIWNDEDEIVFVERYVTRAAAQAGHDRSLAWVRFPIAERPTTMPVPIDRF